MMHLRRLTLLPALGVVPALAFTLALAPSRAAAQASARSVWQAECASCHIAYPPRFLPVQAWRKMLGTLDHHFGVDASVDAATLAALRAYVEAKAGEERDVRAAGELRITRTAWFVREHRKVPPELWRSARVQSAANCQACHTQAAEGSFREHDIRLPR